MTLLLLLACGTPSTERPTTPPRTTASTADPSSSSSSTADSTPTDCAPSLQPAPLRRLSRTTYTRSVAAVAGVEVDPRRLAPDVPVHGFDNAASTAPVNLAAVDGYLRTAEEVAAAWSSEGVCPPERAPEACLEDLLDGPARIAFRRSLEPEERAIYTDLFDLLAEDEPVESALRGVLEAVLQSPQVLYQPELGEGPVDADGGVALSGPERATRLALLLWGAPPDAALLDAAEAGVLQTAEGLSTEVDRMLADPRARDGVADFVEQWAGTRGVESLDRDAVLFPEWSEALAADLREETRRFSAAVLLDGEGTLAALLTAPETIANGRVAALYGLEADDWAPLALDPTERAGLLTQPALLAALAHPNQTSLVRRGRFVRERLLCQALPDPPDDLDISLPPLDEDLGARERFARHTEDPACAGCHLLTDPIGLGFEHYDAIGTWRTHDGLAPIDPTGAVFGAPEPALEGAFVGVPELAGRLGDSPAVAACLVRNTYRLAWAQEPDSTASCTLDSLTRTLTEAGGHVPTLLHALATDPQLHRRPEVRP